jgi:hypothetical protein
VREILAEGAGWLEDSRSLRRTLTEAFTARANAAHRATKLYRTVFFALAAGIAGAMQFWSWKPNEQPSTPQLIGIAATVVVFAASVIAILTDKDSARELDLAQRAVERAQELEDEAADLVSAWPDIDRMIELYQMTKILRDTLEQASIAMAGDQIGLLASMLKLVERSLIIAAGFSTADQHTVCVYQAVPVQGDCRFELRLVAHSRTHECKLSEARTWPEGRGVAGIAFSNNQEILIADLAAPAAQAIFQPVDLTRRYDDDRYRSIIAAPVAVAGSDRPWGIITATSDRVGHFNHDQETGLKPEEAIRVLANYAALSVAIMDARERARSASPSNVN